MRHGLTSTDGPVGGRAGAVARSHRQRAAYAVALALLSTASACGADGPTSPPGNPVPMAGTYPADVAPATAGATAASGPAAMVFAPCYRACAPALVTPDGGQRPLDRPTTGGPTSRYALSPDGRWLAAGDARGVTLRDLATGESRKVAGTGPGLSTPAAWSPDGRWLLVARHVDGRDVRLAAVPVGGGASRPVPVARAAAPALDDAGRLVDWRQTAPGRGELAREGSAAVAVDLRPVVTAGERAGSTVLLGPGDDTVTLLVVRGTAPDGPLVGVVPVTLSTGRPGRRWDVPAGPGDGWAVHAADAGGVLLTRATSTQTLLLRVDPRTGVQTVLTTLPPQSLVVPRGGAGD